jgi:hypothetical protein
VERANTILKAITKAKRRVTLSICGLGWLDETEVEDIPAEAKALNNSAPFEKSFNENNEPRKAARQLAEQTEPTREPDPEHYDHELAEARADQWGSAQAARPRNAINCHKPAGAVVSDVAGERPANAADLDDGLDIPPVRTGDHPAVPERRPKREPSLKEKLLAAIPDLGSVRDVLHYGLEMSKFDGELSKADRDEVAAALRARQKVLMLNGGASHGQHRSPLRSTSPNQLHSL